MFVVLCIFLLLFGFVPDGVYLSDNKRLTVTYLLTYLGNYEITDLSLQQIYKLK